MSFSLFKRIKNLAKTNTEPDNSGQELLIQNVRQGAVIHLRAIGADMEDFDLKVIGRHVYKQGNYEWYELECDKGGEKVWIDLEDDDEIELAIGMRKLKLNDLKITTSDLTHMDDEEEGSFTFEGETYYLEDSDSAVFLRNGEEAKAEKLYYWDFESDSGDKFIGVEKWGNKEYSVTLSESIDLNQVTVFSLS
ncbi:MAG: DUF4178 domain-containing protein [Spirochaetia bacterium]|nr:DUF4178 domain-containing protein [Spirochaetia bacterium]